MEGGQGGGGGTPDPTPAPPTGGDPAPYVAPEWANGLSVDPEILKAPMFQSVKSMDDVVKGYYHAQKMVGADKVVLPNKNSSADEWKAFHQKIGLPTKLEEYAPKLPEAFDNQDFNKKLIEKAYEMNIHPSQLEVVSELFNEMNKNIVDSYDNEQKEELNKTLEGLQKEWGEGFNKQIARANRVVKHFLGDEGHKAVLQSHLANDGTFLRLMAKIGEGMLQSDTFTQESISTFGTTKEEAQRKLNAITGDMNSPYYNAEHRQHKDVLNEVLKYHEILAQQ